jgi:hypothetical protein
MLLDPDPHSQYGSVSKTAKLMLIQENPDPQHCKKPQFMKKRKGMVDVLTPP